MLDSPWFEGWGVDLWAVSDSYRYGISVPDEDPPGNQVTPRVQKFQLLSHSLQRFALMLTPRSIPGEVVSPRILRHAPSCDILVTMRAQMKWEVKGSRRKGKEDWMQEAKKQQYPTNTFACCAKALTRVV
jgi:hypothetical protein